MIEDNIARIRAYRKALKLSIRSLASAAGVSQGGNIRFMDSATWNPTTDLIRKLEAIIPADFQIDGKAQ